MRLIEAITTALTQLWSRIWGQTDFAREAMARVFADNFDGLVITGEDYRVVAASRTARTLLVGNADSELAGRQASEVLPPAMLRAVQRAFAEGRVGEPSPMALTEIGNPAHGGYIVVFVVTLSEVTSAAKPLSRRVVNLTLWDETERRQRETELAYAGTHDPLTGALTRAELLRTAGAMLDEERRRRAGLTLMLIDLRRFRVVNETLGHTQGDMLLRQAVSRIREAGIDIVARLGADVFALVIAGVADEEAEALCARLIARVSEPYMLGARKVVVGAAMGFTSTDVSGFAPELLLSHADLALSKAKSRTGNVAMRFTKVMERKLKERQELDMELRQALALDQLVVLYQPQVDLTTGELVGVEALLRWRHPVRGLILPRDFIGMAEESGEIIAIGGWALREACREVASWPFETRVAVNVSPAQFQFGDIVAEVQAALNDSGLPPDRLDIEITEGMFLRNAEFVTDILERLHGYGVGIALDDFGTGYSSLGYLARLPVDKVKIDRCFVAGLPTDAEAAAIVRAVMTLSEALGKGVVAEGIETADQAWMLRLMGCRIGQGYHFGRARSGAEMADWNTVSASWRSAVG